ncbi:MAG: MBL fold metallo-hydrolase [Thermoanaerobaculia bacterium]|nr:MBL fold metallo-hydrolase [Thermoanaerobaculia bacterium]
MIREVLLSAAILMLASPAFGQLTAPEGSDAPALTIEMVTEKIHVIRGAGGNIAVLSGDDGVLVVDSGTAARSSDVLAAIRGISDKPIRYVVNTHWHPDHTGGNAAIAAGGAMIAHDRTRGWLKRGGIIDGTPVPPAAPAAIPEFTIKFETRIYLNGETVQILPVPGGHTDGDMVVYFVESNVVHVGDMFVADQFPLIDADSGGSIPQLTRNLDGLRAALRSDTRLIPGHGPLSSIEGLVRFSVMLESTSALVVNARNRGESVETMKQNKLLEPWSSWASDLVSADRFIEVLDKTTAGPVRKPSSKKQKGTDATVPPARPKG